MSKSAFRNYLIGIILGLGIVAAYIYNIKKTPTKISEEKRIVLEAPKRERPLEKAVTLVDSDLISADVFGTILKHNSKEISQIFFRVTSDLSFRCSEDFDRCDLNSSSVKTKNFSSHLALAKKQSIPVALIYDLNINSFEYRFYKYKDKLRDKYTPNQKEGIPERPLVFSQAKFRNVIKSDFNRKLKLAKFEKVIFGSELNIYFFGIPSDKSRKAEIAAFWRFIDELRKEHPTKVFSSSFNYEHLKYFNNWSELGRQKIDSLDFIAFSSHPLHSGWSLFPRFEEQLYGFQTQKLAVEPSYFATARHKIQTHKKIYFVDFGYPEDESKEENRKTLLNHIKRNAEVLGLSWTLLPLSSQDLPEAKYFNALSLLDRQGNLNESGKLFFASEPSN